MRYREIIEPILREHECTWEQILAKEDVQRLPRFKGVPVPQYEHIRQECYLALRAAGVPWGTISHIFNRNHSTVRQMAQKCLVINNQAENPNKRYA